MSVKVNKKVAGAAIVATGMVAGAAPVGAATEYDWNVDNGCVALAITDVDINADGAAWEGRFLNGSCQTIEARLYLDIKGSPGSHPQSIQMLREYSSGHIELSHDFGPNDVQTAEVVGHHWCFRTRVSGQAYSPWQVINKNGSTFDVCS